MVPFDVLPPTPTRTAGTGVGTAAGVDLLPLILTAAAVLAAVMVALVVIAILRARRPQGPAGPGVPGGPGIPPQTGSTRAA